MKTKIFNQSSDKQNSKTMITDNSLKEKGTIISGLESNELSSNELYPIAGFLLSFSGTEFGEYWVLREGNKNSIGSGANCKICLGEGTVSTSHATIIVRRSKKDNRLMFIIKDNGSSNGVLVNNEDIELEAFECKNLDKITIGNYELLLIATDKEFHKLSVNPNFVGRKGINKTPTVNKNPYNNATKIV